MLYLVMPHKDAATNVSVGTYTRVSIRKLDKTRVIILTITVQASTVDVRI